LGAVVRGALFFSPAAIRDGGCLLAGRGRRIVRVDGNFDPIAPVLLRAIERIIGARNQRINRGGRRAGCDSDTDRRRNTLAPAQDSGSGERRPHALGGDCGFERGARQERYKLLATKAADQVGCAQRFAHNPREELQDRVAGRMPILIVDRFSLLAGFAESLSQPGFPAVCT
jgi:hypothetical protein